MRILDAGHDYVLFGLDGGGSQRLTFVKREGENFPFNEGSHGGVNVQEVLRALIDRNDYLYRQKPCAETESAGGCLRTALLLYELRAARRHGRQLTLQQTQELCCGTPCQICGHIGCNQHSAKPAASADFPPSGGAKTE